MSESSRYDHQGASGRDKMKHFKFRIFTVIPLNAQIIYSNQRGQLSEKLRRDDIQYQDLNLDFIQGRYDVSSSVSVRKECKYHLLPLLLHLTEVGF